MIAFPRSSVQTLSLLVALAAPALAQEQEGASDAPEAAAAETEDAAEKKGRGELDLGKPTLPVDWVDAFRWRSVGPANMGGRITDVVVNPQDRCEYWVATASGGLLHTTNNGVTYEHQFDHERTVSLGAIAVSASNPEIVWVGTGECNPRNSVGWGDGVYKSTDSGKTWTHMGLEKGFQTGAVVIHPTDPSIVYVGALGRLWGSNEERGLFKTKDGGETWDKILFIDEDTGVIDVKMHPEDPDTLLVATYERRRDMFDTNDPARKWGEGSALYRTKDGGRTFTRVTKGLPSCRLGRIGIDFYRKQPNVVYVVLESERITQVPEDAAYIGLRGENAEIGARITEVTEESPAEEAGLQAGDVVLRVNDQTIIAYDDLLKQVNTSLAGETDEYEVVRDRESQVIEVTYAIRPENEEDAEERADVHGRPRPGRHSGGLGGQRQNVGDEQGPDGHEYGGVYRSEDGGESWTRVNSVNPRPMYYSEIRVDPSDDNYVYVLGTSLYRSKDGGATFTPDGGRGIHVDHHALWIDPADGRHMILGNDGGLHVTWSRMDEWDHHNYVAIGQFYNVTCDSTRDYKVYGGLQDNGSWGGPNRIMEGTVNTDWIRVGGGDGFVCRVDRHDPDLVYYESQNGRMGRTNLRTGEGGSLRPRGSRDVRYRFNWNTPFILSNHNSKIFYSAGNYVFRSLDRGRGQRRISPEITATERGAAVALGESPIDPGVLFVGTDDGALWTTRDGGHEWIDLWTLNAEDAPKPAEAVEAVAASSAGAGENGSNGNGQESGQEAGPLTGRWEAKARGEGIAGEGQGHFWFEIEHTSEARFKGRLESEIGTGPIEGRFDPEADELSFAFEAEQLRLEFDAKVAGDSMEGTITGAGGAFSFEFSATRVRPEQAEVAQVEEQAEPAASEESTAEKKDKKKKFKENTIDQLLPGRRYVSNIVPSRFREKRVYVTFDGHRSDDGAPRVFVSEDLGETWSSLSANLPDSAGSARGFAEDLTNENLLFLGTEFGAWASIDRGSSWTPLNNNLPTVAVHDFALHPSSGELIAGTHGRSVWIVDITALRDMSEESVDADAHLYPVNEVVRWRRGQRRGQSGTRRFVGENPPTGATILYSLDKKPRAISLKVTDTAGNTLRVLEASREKGLHRVTWDLTRARSPEEQAEQAQRFQQFRGRRGGGGFRGRGRFRGGRSVSLGKYVVVLEADGEVMRREFEIVADPNQPDARYLEYEEWNETRFDVDKEDGDGGEEPDDDDV